MTRARIAALLGATALVTPLLVYLSRGSAAEPDGLVANTLAVQLALKQGREHMSKDAYGSAVHVLEQELPKINGNREYLACLRDAYRGYVKELCRSNQP